MFPQPPGVNIPLLSARKVRDADGKDKDGLCQLHRRIPTDSGCTQLQERRKMGVKRLLQVQVALWSRYSRLDFGREPELSCPSKSSKKSSGLSLKRPESSAECWEPFLHPGMAQLELELFRREENSKLP